MTILPLSLSARLHTHLLYCQCSSREKPKLMAALIERPSSYEPIIQRSDPCFLSCGLPRKSRKLVLLLLNVVDIVLGGTLFHMPISI